ncbi:hypothetical protein BaRGS_00005958 [Batillaria attramentaria]|uniref:Uncharacterized protein n=1 Tax=Batillaria attramentaria TaxID=370345 RepID=A0ABD0LU44_9CAEN
MHRDAIKVFWHTVRIYRDGQKRALSLVMADVTWECDSQYSGLYSGTPLFYALFTSSPPSPLQQPPLYTDEGKKDEYDSGRYSTYSREFSRGPVRVPKKRSTGVFHSVTMRTWLAGDGGMGKVKEGGCVRLGLGG